MNTILKTFAVLSLCVLAISVHAQSNAGREDDPYFLLADKALDAIEQGDYSKAASRLREAIAMRPSDPETILLMSNLGMVYSYMGKDSLALATLEDAMQKAPSMKVLKTNHARALIAAGRKAQAYNELADIVRADSAGVEGRYLHGLLSLELSDLETAAADLAVLAAAEPESVRTAAAMSALLDAQGRHKEATPYLCRLVEKSGEAEDYAALANSYIAQGLLSDAGTTISDGLAKYPGSGELYFSRARLNQARYSLDEAKADARKAESLGIERARIRATGL